MHRRQFTALGLTGAAAVLAGCSSMAFATDPVINGLTSGVSGLSSSQAAGGLGSMLGMAKGKLPSTDFSSLSKLLPNADKYLKAAADAGISTSSITDAAGLNSAFSKLGISPDQARGMMNNVADYVGKSGGDSAKSMLNRALGR